jgi:hypothetical protein
MPGVLVDEDGVAENGARREQADFVGPLDWRHPVAPGHFEELGHALGDVGCQGPAALARRRR